MPRCPHALIENYAYNGIAELESLQVLKNEPFASIGNPFEIVNIFGGKEGYLNAIAELKNLLYQMTCMIFLSLRHTRK